MKNFYRFLICISFYTVTGNAQVIYERTFSPVFPSIQHTIQLSDTSTVSFANNSECYFAAYLHIDQNGNKISSGGVDNESTHSLGMRALGGDSVLIWYRVGPLDFDGPNYFRIILWTDNNYVQLVSDSSDFNFWEDWNLSYEAFLLKDDKIIYRKEDSLYVFHISTQQLLNKIVVPEINIVYTFLDHIVVFAYPADPIVYDINLIEVTHWDTGQQHPVSNYESMGLDSFLIGIHTQTDANLHIVNGLTEESLELDLSGYFTFIEEIQVNQDGLFVKGKQGSFDYLVHFNEQLEVINETIIELPSLAGLFTYTYYADRVYAWKTDGLSNYDANYRVTYHYPDASPIQFVDISLDSVWIDSIFYWPPDQHLPAKLFLLLQFTNHSTDTVHSFTYHFEGPQSTQCDPGVYPAFVEGILIPPGQPGIIPFTTWSWEVAENIPFVRMFYVQHANNHLDDNIADNHFQLTYLLSAITPILENTMSLWPNPFHDYLETPENFTNLKMYNSLGHIVSTGTNRLDHLRSLVPGTYYIQGLKDQKSYFSRVIKIE